MKNPFIRIRPSPLGNRSIDYIYLNINGIESVTHRFISSHADAQPVGSEITMLSGAKHFTAHHRDEVIAFINENLESQDEIR